MIFRRKPEITAHYDALWLLGGGLLLAACAAVIPFSHYFGYDYEVPDMPLLALFLGLFAAGWLFLGLVWLIARRPNLGQSGETTGLLRGRRLLIFMIAVGLLARLLMLFSTPMMEDDFQRYLWDGAVTASGHNPYAIAPQTVLSGLSGEDRLNELAAQSGTVLERVNHPHLRTIYPPTAQLGFALAYFIEPFSLNAWRGLIILCELATLTLLLAFLQTLGKPLLWSAIYWWNPLVLKELAHSGHMEALLVPLLLGAIWAAWRMRYLSASLLLALATGVKLWPALLAPLLFRPLLTAPRRAIAPALLFAALLGLMAAPVLRAGLDDSSGFVAYATHWKTNSALFPTLEGAMVWLASGDAAQLAGGRLARLLIVLGLGGLALWLARTPAPNARDLLNRAFLLAAAVFLLSPAQFPWYALWFAPFLAFQPVAGLLLLMPLLQIYYLAFYFMVQDMPDFHASYMVWLIWTPVWALLLLQFAPGLHDLRSRLGLAREAAS